MRIHQLNITIILIASILLLRGLNCESATTSIYDVLKSHGLPMGLLPKGVKDFSFDDSGGFEVHLDQPCNAKFENELHYDQNISEIVWLSRICRSTLTLILSNNLLIRRRHLGTSDTNSVTKNWQWLLYESLTRLKRDSGTIAQSSNWVFRFLYVHFFRESGKSGRTLHSSVCLLVVFCIVQSLQSSHTNFHYFQHLRLKFHAAKYKNLGLSKAQITVSNSLWI